MAGVSLMDLEKVVVALFLLLVSRVRVGEEQYDELDRRCQRIARSLGLSVSLSVFIAIILKRSSNN